MAAFGMKVLTIVVVVGKDLDEFKGERGREGREGGKEKERKGRKEKKREGKKGGEERGEERERKEKRKERKGGKTWVIILYISMEMVVLFGYLPRISCFILTVVDLQPR